MIEIAVDDTKPCDREYLARSRVTTANVAQLETGEPFLAGTPAMITQPSQQLWGGNIATPLQSVI